MKLKFLPLLLLLCPMAYANQLTDAIAKGQADLTANTATLQTASSAGSEASRHYDHLKQDVLPPLELTKTQYQADVSAYNTENGAVKTAIDVHNSNRCMQPACVTAYNAERDQLNGKALDMQSRERLLDQRHDNLTTMYKNLYTDAQDTSQKMKQARADYDRALADRKGIVDSLNKLKAESETCSKQLKAQGKATVEALKLKCGKVEFDASDKNLPPAPPDAPHE